MKNDFREFYDTNYILHDLTDEDYLIHGEWASNLRRFVDKVRTRTGKWRYIYPEDLKKKTENLKRDISYNVRNLRSRITGRNKTFEDKEKNIYDGYIYRRQNQFGGIGMGKYEKRRNLVETTKKSDKNDSRNLNEHYSHVDPDQMRRAKKQYDDDRKHYQDIRVRGAIDYTLKRNDDNERAYRKHIEQTKLNKLNKLREEYKQYKKANKFRVKRNLMK